MSETTEIKTAIVKVNKTADKKQYMRDYMRTYTAKNKNKELNRKTTANYRKKYDIPDDFYKEYGTYTCVMWKAIQTIKKIKEEHPEHYPTLFKYI